MRSQGGDEFACLVAVRQDWDQLSRPTCKMFNAVAVMYRAKRPKSGYVFFDSRITL